MSASGSEGSPGPVSIRSPRRKSPARQRAEKLQLLARCQLAPDEYNLYRFDEAGKDVPFMLDYLPRAALWGRVRPAVNEPAWFPLLDNKLLFHLHYGAFGLPLPPLHGVYEPSWGFDRAGRPLTTPAELRALLLETRPPKLVVKPLGGMMGRNVLILDELAYPEAGVEAVTNTGERLGFEALVERLAQRPPPIRRGGQPPADLSGYLIQDKVAQHPFLNAIAPYTTNTFRVVTFVDADGEARVHFTTLRLGRRGNAIDNWDSGGLSVGVDRTTGELGPAVLKSALGREWVEVHPDSGVRFAGERVPGWDGLLDACRRAARLTPGIRYVGWDVALSPEGPVLIEGNSDWELPAMQMMLPRGFLQPDVRAQLARFGLEFPGGRLPTPNPRQWWTMLRDPRWRPVVIPPPLGKALDAVKRRRSAPPSPSREEGSIEATPSAAAGAAATGADLDP